MLRLTLALAFAQSGFHGFIASFPLAMLAVGRSDAEIGALMGFAAIVNIPAALLSGGLIDRFGGRLVFLGGVAAFAVASAVLAAGIVGPGSGVVPLLLVRALQGIGLAAVLPAGLSLVPGLVPKARLGTALGMAGVGANVSLAAAPPLSLAVLSAASFSAVAVVFLVTVLAGAALMWSLRPRVATDGDGARERHDRADGGAAAADGASDHAVADGDDTSDEGRRARATRAVRSFSPSWRGSWAHPVVIALLFLVHWGVVVGYLPQRADAARADVGPFFTGDALALLLLRIPSGYLAQRLGSLRLVLCGLAITGGAVMLLLLPPTTPLLFVAGVGSGAGAALIIPPLMLELSNRSDEADRGSAFALFTVSFSIGVAIGSLGMAPLIDRIGFETALLSGIGCIAAAMLVAVFDPRLRQRAVAPATG